MDVIIYFEYTNQNTQGAMEECAYVLKEQDLQDYRLIKIYVKEAVPAGKHSGSVPGKSSAGRFIHKLLVPGQYLRNCYSRRKQEKLRSKMGERLRQELAAYLKEWDEVSLYYGENVGAESWIRGFLPFREFDAYLEKKWVYRLMELAECSHFVMLGDVPYSKELLWKLAPRMKSLLWIAPDRAAEEELEDFGEEFYQETGLAINLQFLPTGTTYGQLVIPGYMVKEAVNIVDLTEGKYIPRFEPPEGSIWIDCAADSDKKRRIAARRLSCRLISLRKQWKNASSA